MRSYLAARIWAGLFPILKSVWNKYLMILTLIICWNGIWFHLSGGEKQKIACASVTMPDPDVMVLDEPASNLDCRSIQILADIIAVWKNNGKTVIIAEHRLNYLKAVADRVIYMEDGQIVEDVPAKQFWNLPVEVIKQRGLRSIVPVTFERVPPLCHGNGILEVKNFHFSYNGVLDLDIPSLSIPAGAVVGIIGNNGTGKTTFARCLCPDWRGKLPVRLV